MRSRLRSFDSKISFFAFADIITAVSGMLIFITLLLATDLEHRADGSSQGGDPETQRQLDETLRQQSETEMRNQRLQSLLAAAESAPAPEKLQSDVDRLRAELAEERKKQAAVSNQIAASQGAIEARDQTLGLTDIKGAIRSAADRANDLTRQEATVHDEMASLDRQVARAQERLLKLRQLDGQLWLIPEKGGSKEPIIVTVSGTGATIERYEHPEQRKQLGRADAEPGFRSYLSTAKPTDQYVLFEIKPSGIKLTQQLLQTARAMHFEVGFDALEEGRTVRVQAPPVIDETTPEPERPTPLPGGSGRSGAGRNASGAGSATTPATNTTTVPLPPKASPTSPPASTNPPAPPPPAKKSWWQRLLEWLHLA
jgi:hypothetical protein